MADGAVFLAVDLGAGSGRIIAGLMLGGRLSLEEVYRFKNEPVEKSGNLYWDFEGLWAGVPTVTISSPGSARNSAILEKAFAPYS